MKINRNGFIRHLERLACSGQCKQAAFSGAFAVNALTPDQLLFIGAPGIPDVEALTEEIGVADIDLLIKSLKLLTGAGNEGQEVDVYVDGNRLVVDDGARGVQRLLLASPKTIGTRLEPANVEHLQKQRPKGKGIPLTKSVLEGVSSTFSLYKAVEVELHVEKNGMKLRVGTEKTHFAEFELAKGKNAENYTLLFTGHLVDVFKVITDFSSAQVQLSGPDKPIWITDGGYEYVLSPHKRSADDAVKESVKGAEELEAFDGEEAPKAAPKAKAKAKKS